ncbi:hepatocyte cell adhesion molecule-like isoform X3 [Callorhinchus milii]|uniref:hepatocyte cell adhesion molecule-like isoform X3 n=1 Tax=Callorhinchus milii TaxID=7868 RepID=UPI001C3F749D|nr:hepatocyte cell adhesion molecule-like isoform X3 [Callorhinchus milii]
MVTLFRIITVLLCARLGSPAVWAIPDTVTNLSVGQDVQFPVIHDNNMKYEVTARRESPYSIKILGWNSDQPFSIGNAHIVHPLYRDRVQLTVNGSLLLKNVHMEDSAEYRIQTNYLGAVLRQRDQLTFHLKVFEPVAQPVVKVTTNCSVPAATLTCSAPNGTNPLLHWEKVLGFAGNTVVYNGTTLHLSNVTGRERDSYTCVAHNPVSQTASEPVTTDLCPDSGSAGGSQNNERVRSPVGVPTLCDRPDGEPWSWLTLHCRAGDVLY